MEPTLTLLPDGEQEQYMLELAKKEDLQLAKVTYLIFQMVVKQIPLSLVITECELLENIIEYERYLFTQVKDDFYRCEGEREELLQALDSKLEDIRLSISKFKAYGENK